MIGLEHNYSLANKNRKKDASRFAKMKRQLAQATKRITQLETELSFSLTDLDIERAM